jgi:glycosyltransferase involved in cell wall biosynthesis
MALNVDLLPSVSLVVAMRNEEAHIQRCLKSLLDQDYPPDRLSVIVADGSSTDRSVAIVENAIHDRPSFHLIANSRLTQAAGWNAGIRRARADVVGIVSAHTELASNYVSAAVETLLRTDAAMVGGPARAISSTVTGRAIALAMSTPFGVGGARFRYLSKEADVDTVFMGVCRRETYLKFPFDEEMVRDQDDELSYRLLDAGLRIVCNPAIQSSYASRPSLIALARQYADYGFWKIRVITKHPAQTRLRHIIPATLVIALLASAVSAQGLPMSRFLLGLTAGSYAAANIAASVYFGRKAGWRVAALMPVAYATLHLSYGSGFIAGLAHLGYSRVRRNRVMGPLSAESPADRE